MGVLFQFFGIINCFFMSRRAFEGTVFIEKPPHEAIREAVWREKYCLFVLFSIFARDNAHFLLEDLGEVLRVTESYREGDA